MNPTELTEVTARLPVDAEHLALQRHLVDAARIDVPDKSTGLGAGVMHRASGAPGAWEPVVASGASRPYTILPRVMSTGTSIVNSRR